MEKVWAPPAQAQERRVPTIWAALLLICSGPASTRLLSYYAVTVGLAQTRPCRGAATEGVPARKPMLVAYLHSTAYFQTREWGQWCPSEHFLMDIRGRQSSILGWIPGRVHPAFSDGPPEGRRSTKCTRVCVTGNSHAFFECGRDFIVGLS